MNEHRTSPTGELVSDPLRTAYLRTLGVLVAAVAVGAVLGGWVAWNMDVDGTLAAAILGQVPIFVGAALAGAIPLFWALKARRRWMAARNAPDDLTQ